MDQFLFPGASKYFGLLNTFHIKDKVDHCLLLMSTHRNNYKSKSIILLKKLLLGIENKLVNYHS